MAGFNAMPALSSSATPTADAPGLNAGASLHVDFGDPDLNFDNALLDNVNIQNLPFTPSYDFDAFSTFDDPFSLSTATRGPYNGGHGLGGLSGGSSLGNGARTGTDLPPHPGHGDPEAFINVGEEGSSPQELDTKLLGFGALISKVALLDESGALLDIDMSAELYGMFFVAEDVFGGADAAAAAAGRPVELTCYRRNLWQCSGQITLPRQRIAAIATEQGRQVEVLDLAASITAIESIEGKPTEIISIPWKSSAGGGTGGSDEPSKVAGAPPRAPLDLTAGQELDGGHRVSVPVAWKRLQFKHATANNGRRKGLQQHYVVQINLLAKTARLDGSGDDYVKVAEIQSGPVIVRGRSPRNFDSKKDIQLTGERKPERKSTDPSSGSTLVPAPVPAGNGAAGQLGKPQERTDLAQNMQRYHSLGNVQSSTPTNMDWTAPFPSPSPHPAKKVTLSPNLARPPVPPWVPPSDANNMSMNSSLKNGRGGEALSMTSGGPMQQHNRPSASTMPINLSLSEDERSPNRAGSDGLQSPSLSKSIAGAAVSGPNLGSSPKENEDDLLYEYFPLSLDDWMPPVDAVYRPHVVHHTVVPPEVKAQQTRSKTKRYFAAE